MLNDLSIYKADIQKIEGTTESLKEEIDYLKDTIVTLDDHIQLILKEMLETRNLAHLTWALAEWRETDLLDPRFLSGRVPMFMASLGEGIVISHGSTIP